MSLQQQASGWKRSGRNVGGYFGEVIDIDSVLTDCAEAARSHGWQVEELPAGSGRTLLTLTRPARDTAPAPMCVYVSTGIHGDEPGGPLAARQLLQENQWPAGLDLWLCPCLNPGGFALNQRENPDGLDLNRQYLRPTAPETLAHIQWLERQPHFDLSLCLHEDWESDGFYVYELNPDHRPSLAPRMIAAIERVCPIDHSSEIEGRAAEGGIIRPGTDPRTRPQWPESFYLITNNSRLSYTLEAPSDFPLPARVAALVAGVNSAIARLVGANA
jgi:protein MpaA